MDNFKCKPPCPPPCPGPDLPDFCPPPKPPAMCEPCPSVVPGMSLVETVQDLSNRLNTMCGVYNDVMANSYATLHNLQRAAQENGAYYGDCEVWTEQGYWADESAGYTLTHKACIDRRGDPICMELHLAYSNTTNSQIKQGLFDASKITYADKMVTAVPVKEGTGWTGNAIWHGAPIASSPLPTGYTVGFTRSGVMRVYSNAVTVDQMLRDTVENAMGCPGVLIMNGQLTEDSWRTDIPLKDQQTERVVMGQNLDTREVIILTCGSENNVNMKGLTSAACAQILLQYGCDIAVELTEGADAGATDKGSLMFVPKANEVPATYAFWFISRKRFYTTDYERELAMLMQNYGQAIWNTYLNKNEIEKTQMDLANEVLARIEGDTTLTNNLNAEIARATAAEEKLTTDLNTERTERIEGDTTLTNNLNAEIERATAAETKLTNDLAAEVERATAAETVLTNNLNAEVQRATAAEEKLTTDLNAEVVRATAAETKLTEDLAAEVERATAAETLLTTNLDNEIERAKAAEAAETTRATQAETALSNAITLEEQRRIQGDEALTASINQETTRATTAENTLTTNLTNEVERAKAAEAELHADVEKEITDRTAAVAAEAQARTEADTTLQTNINTEIADRQAAITAEAQARTEADAQLQANIDALATRVTTLEGNVTTLRSLYDTLAKQTAAMDTTITVVQQTITAIETALNNVKATIEEIRNGTIVLPYVRLTGDRMTGALSIETQNRTGALTVTDTYSGAYAIKAVGHSDIQPITYTTTIGSGIEITGHQDGTSSDMTTHASFNSFSMSITDSASKDDVTIRETGISINEISSDGNQRIFDVNPKRLRYRQDTSTPGILYEITVGVSPPISGREPDGTLYIRGAKSVQLDSVIISGVANPVGAYDVVNKYTLDTAIAAGVTPATTTTLGGIIVGDNLTVEANGRLSANAGAYTLPAATTTTLGGVKVGENLTVTADGTLNATGGYTPADASKTAKGVVQIGDGIDVASGTISVPTATTAAAGLVKPGSNLTVTADGTLNAPAPGISQATADATYLPKAGGTITGNIIGTDVGLVSPGSASGLTVTATGSKLSGQSVSLSNSPTDTIPVKLQNVAAPTDALDAVNLATMQAAVAGVPEYQLPTASASQLGGVKIGSNISVAADGTISTHAPYALPTASASTLGGVKVGSNLSVDANGVLSAAAGGMTQAQADARYLQLTGGTLTNNLVVSYPNGGRIGIAPTMTTSIYNLISSSTADNTQRHTLRLQAKDITLDMNGPLDLMSQRIVNVATPTADADAATKAYVDGKSLTTGNMSISAVRKWESDQTQTSMILTNIDAKYTIIGNIIVYSGKFMSNIQTLAPGNKVIIAASLSGLKRELDITYSPCTLIYSNDFGLGGSLSKINYDAGICGCISADLQYDVTLDIRIPITNNVTNFSHFSFSGMIYLK